MLRSERCRNSIAYRGDEFELRCTCFGYQQNAFQLSTTENPDSFYLNIFTCKHNMLQRHTTQQLLEADYKIPKQYSIKKKAHRTLKPFLLIQEFLKWTKLFNFKFYRLQSIYIIYNPNIHERCNYSIPIGKQLAKLILLHQLFLFSIGVLQMKSQYKKKTIY